MKVPSAGPTFLLFSIATGSINTHAQTVGGALNMVFPRKGARIGPWMGEPSSEPNKGEASYSSRSSVKGVKTGGRMASLRLRRLAPYERSGGSEMLDMTLDELAPSVQQAPVIQSE